ncbi:auxin response factor 17-like isoform X1 [Camellia sinensis]|uniref:auxin response factor 17-like isoform X1 n=1 Tax=Camellia sinensis TaxID=4442 RepID=UPI00103665C9|nr:auxin response factor 17-like isoform X1 [Camellia sinensis]XP_028059950.1 auxin response factor 17-like isoform X1 [Camellia sinensis]
MIASTILIWIGMGRNPVDSKVVARVYVDFSAVVTLLLGGALACYGLVLFLKMRKVRSERASSEMRKVTWDEPDVLQNVKRVSPWQIEYVEPTPLLHSAFPPAKKFRFPQNPGLPTDGKGDLFFPIPGPSNSMIGYLKPSLMNYNSFPAGMQGARQDTFFCIKFIQRDK